MTRSQKDVYGKLKLTDSDLDIIRACPYGGIKNTGATCYLNTYVQSLFFNRDLRGVLLTTDYICEAPLTALQNIMAELFMGNMKAVDPIRFVDSLAICRETQEDSHEFATLFINWLHKNIRHSSVRALFEGSLINTFICPSCGSELSHSEPFLDLRLNVTTYGNIEDLVRSLSDRCDIIEGYSCSSEVCLGKIVDITRHTSVKTLPKYLTLVLNRFSFDRSDGSREKISTPVKIKLNNLQIVPGKTYTCFGIIEHVSSTVSSGHYIGHFRDVFGDNAWYTFDDEDVKEAKKFGSDVFSSNAAYVIHYVDVAGGASPLKSIDMNPLLYEKILAENSERMEILNSKKSIKRDIESQFSLRKDQIESLRSSKFSEYAQNEWVVVSTDWLRDWGLGGDISRRVRGGETMAHLNGSVCEHGKLSPLSVVQGRVKYVPREIIGDLSAPSIRESVCEPCASDFREQILRVLQFGEMLEDLLKHSETVSEDFYWINEKMLRGKFSAAFRSSITSVENVLKKVSAWKSQTIEKFDLAEGVMCIQHNNLRIDAESVLKRKPKKLIDDLVSTSCFCPVFVPRLVVSEICSPRDTCAECAQQESSRETFTKFLSHLLIRKDVEVPYTAIPIAWIRRVIRGASGSHYEFKSIVCDHGKLVRNGAKFLLVSRDEWDMMQSKNFQDTMLGRSGGDVPVVGVEECDECSNFSGSKSCNIRVFDGSVSSGEVFDHERGVTILHRPGRSRLFGTTGELDLEVMLGKDLKTRLLDLGIMGDEEVHEGAENDMNLYVSHPLLRGSLIRLEDESSVREIVAKALEGNTKAREISHNGMSQETLHVEFLVDRKSAVGPRKKARRVQVDDSDAGLKGSILRELQDEGNDGVIDLS